MVTVNENISMRYSSLLNKINEAKELLVEIENGKEFLSEKDIESFKSIRESLSKREKVLKTEEVKDIILDDYEREMSVVLYFLKTNKNM